MLVMKAMGVMPVITPGAARGAVAFQRFPRKRLVICFRGTLTFLFPFHSSARRGSRFLLVKIDCDKLYGKYCFIYVEEIMRDIYFVATDLRPFLN